MSYNTLLINTIKTIIHLFIVKIFIIKLSIKIFQIRVSNAVHITICTALLTLIINQINIEYIFH